MLIPLPLDFIETFFSSRATHQDSAEKFAAALVSRLHCRLLVRDDELFVENLGSTNGTYVNDEPVDRATLRAGDRLRTGRVELTVFAE